ncbi:hypothetical protein [Dyella sp.]|jgi:hypothetical protein|uniref:hypothetical protein n=1 Tax=Dyella sp. TaxID=1869338 RepID=UPI002D781688|nr:hypothetical protein [Dyella sp.]HET6432976.1 hypothetical protein [Dyella sp.]
MKLNLKNAEVRRMLDLYCKYLDQEEGLRASMDDIVEGIVLYFLDEHPQFRDWNFRRRSPDGVVKARP